jgi:5-(carboxyamino)imidazole ribonucleotide synthase
LIGVLGGGQLGRMLGLAGLPLDQRFTFLDPNPDSPARVAGDLIVADYSDEDALDRLAELADVVTYEFENVPASCADRLAESVPVFPTASALEVAQDRLIEKQTLERVGIDVAPFAPAESLDDVRAVAETMGYPVILKRRRGGYDGKGQAVVLHESELEEAFRSVGGANLIVEQLISFDRELSVIAVRGKDGSVVSYPLIENHHKDGILRLSLAPAPDLDPFLQRSAEAFAERLMGSLDYVGVLTMELFEFDEQLLVNEIAPRVHNSGHWTIEGAETSQFENHVRACLGLPLGRTDALGWSAMVNLIGEVPPIPKIAKTPGAHIHVYGKELRPGRKLGHVTIRSDQPFWWRTRWPVSDWLDLGDIGF